jgi:hypothetical protein
MALNISNTVSTPQSIALQFKLNPTPLMPLNFGTQTSTPAIPKQNLYGGVTGYQNNATMPAVTPRTITPITSAGTQTQNQNQSYQTTQPAQQNTGLLTSLKSQLLNTQNQLNTATNAGYGANDEIKYDSTGNVIPKGQTDTSIPANTFPGIMQALIQKSNQGNMAVDIARQNQQNLTNQIGQQSANIVGQGADLAFKTGEEGALQQLGAIKEAAAQQNVANALNANQQNLSGLETAAGLAKPSASYPFVFNPTTGQFTNASGGGVLDPASAAQGVLNGSMSYDQAKSALSYLGGTGEAQLQAAIQKINPNANINQLQAQGAGQSAIFQNLPTLTASETAAQGIQQQITSYLQSHPNLNPSIFSDANSFIQFLQGKTSNPEQQTLSNYLNEYISTLAPILGIGGDTTNLKTEIAQSMVNAKASGTSIVDVLNNISQLAHGKIQNIQSGAMGGGVVTGGNTGGNMFGSFF